MVIPGTQVLGPEIPMCSAVVRVHFWYHNFVFSPSSSPKNSKFLIFSYSSRIYCEPGTARIYPYSIANESLERARHGTIRFLYKLFAVIANEFVKVEMSVEA